jgi:ATP-binding cassette subfamily C protein LapB
MSDRVVAFDINAGAVATAVSPGPRMGAAAAPVRPQPNSRALNRAQLASVYAGLVGAEIAVADILEKIQIASPSGQIGIGEVALALRGNGLATSVERLEKPSADHLPALAEMTSGQIVLVLAATTDGFQIYDTSCRDMRAEVARKDFEQVYTGRLLRARISVAELETRHVENTARVHWFWGEFKRYKRQLGEVAAGSLERICWRWRCRCFRCRFTIG